MEDGGGWHLYRTALSSEVWNSQADCHYCFVLDRHRYLTPMADTSIRMLSAQILGSLESQPSPAVGQNITSGSLKDSSCGRKSSEHGSDQVWGTPSHPPQWDACGTGTTIPRWGEGARAGKCSDIQHSALQAIPHIYCLYDLTEITYFATRTLRTTVIGGFFRLFAELRARYTTYAASMASRTVHTK